MPVIPILLTDTAKTVEYKLYLARVMVERAQETERTRVYRAYYHGQHELMLNEDQRAFLAGIISDEADWPIDNKCLTVVRKIKGRLEVRGWRDAQGNKTLIEDADGDPEEQPQAPGDAAGGNQVTQQAQPVLASAAGWWLDNNMERWEKELYKAALRDEEAYIIVGHDGQRPVFEWVEKWDGNDGVYMVYEDPKTKRKPMVALKYWWAVSPTDLYGGRIGLGPAPYANAPGNQWSAGTWSDPTAATLPCTVWPNTAGGSSYVKRCTIYTQGAVYKYAYFVNDKQKEAYNIAGPKTEDGWWPVRDPSDTAWPLAWVDGDRQPLGLAVIPFVTPDGSVIDGVIGLNNALNKANLDLLAAADQTGFGLLVAKYETMPPLVSDPTQPQDGLGLRPGRVLETTGEVFKLPADDMDGLLNVARHWVQAIAANSDIPVYEFTPTLTEVPSGNALQMLDKSLSDRADECIHSYTSSWRQVMTLAQRLDVMYGDMVGEVQRLTPIWKSTRRETTETQMASTQLQRMQQSAQRDQQNAQQADALRRAGGVPGIAERLSMMGQAADGPPASPSVNGGKGGSA